LVLIIVAAIEISAMPIYLFRNVRLLVRHPWNGTLHQAHCRDSCTNWYGVFNAVYSPCYL